MFCGYCSPARKDQFPNITVKGAYISECFPEKPNQYCARKYGEMAQVIMEAGKLKITMQVISWKPGKSWCYSSNPWTIRLENQEKLTL